eukprot:PhF_6_TR26062/c0_g1_i3/m.36750
MSDEEFFRAHGSFYRKTSTSNRFEIVNPTARTQVVLHVEDSVFVLSVVDEKARSYIDIDIGEGIMMSHSDKHAVVNWSVESGNDMYDFQFIFTDGITCMKKFIVYFDWAMYCVLTGRPVPKPTGFEDDSRESVESRSDIEWVTAMMSHCDIDEDEEEGELEDTGRQTARPNGGGMNRCLADSVMYEHALVAKTKADGTCAFAAYKYDDKGLLESTEDFEGVQEFLPEPLRKGTRMAPVQSLLTDSETHVILRDELQASKLFDIDLTSGKCVQEFQAAESGAVWDIKCVQTAGEYDPNLVSCTAGNVAFAIDRRLNGEKCVVAPKGKTIVDFCHKLGSTETFTCHATNSQGHLAIGDKKGQIRLFSGAPGTQKSEGKGAHPKTAKTLLPGLEKPIIGMDITDDGNYVLATCDKFLVVVATTFREEDGSCANGFSNRMGAHKKPPVKLELTSQQIASVGGFQRVQFGKATFESNPTGSQHWIVCNVGPLIARWDFEKVRQAMEKGIPNANVKAAVVKESSVVKSCVVVLPSSSMATPVKFITQNYNFQYPSTNKTPKKKI